MRFVNCPHLRETAFDRRVTLPTFSRAREDAVVELLSLTLAGSAFFGRKDTTKA